MLPLLAAALGALAPIVAPSPTMSWLGAGPQDGPDSHHADQAPGESSARYGDLEPVLPASLVPS